MLDVMALSLGGEPETAMEERAMSARLISVGWHQSREIAAKPKVASSRRTYHHSSEHSSES